MFILCVGHHLSQLVQAFGENVIGSERAEDFK